MGFQPDTMTVSPETQRAPDEMRSHRRLDDHKRAEYKAIEHVSATAVAKIFLEACATISMFGWELMIRAIASRMRG